MTILRIAVRVQARCLDARRREVAELLLSLGADPADEQALWINPGAALELLLRYGLKPDATIHAITLMGRELSRAARGGHADRVKLLLANGARTDELFEDESPSRHAIESRNLSIAQVLEEAGRRPLSGLMWNSSPRGVSAGRAPPPIVLMATDTGRVDAARLTLDLGFDPDFLDEIVALTRRQARIRRRSSGCHWNAARVPRLSEPC